MPTTILSYRSPPRPDRRPFPASRKKAAAIHDQRLSRNHACLIREQEQDGPDMILRFENPPDAGLLHIHLEIVWQAKFDHLLNVIGSSEERRVGTEGVRTCRSRCVQNH